MSYVNFVVCRCCVGSLSRVPFHVSGLTGKLSVMFWKYEGHEECIVFLPFFFFAAVFMLWCIKPPP